MTTNRTSKARKQRGSGQHGYGKTHRGAGNRGGRGRAGSGKKADQKKPRFWKKTDYFGKKGFTRIKKKKDNNIINFKKLQEQLDFFIKKGFAKDEKGLIVVDLKKAGFNKLLSNGEIKQKFKIMIPSASKNAVEKLKKAGGEVILE